MRSPGRGWCGYPAGALLLNELHLLPAADKSAAAHLRHGHFVATYVAHVLLADLLNGHRSCLRLPLRRFPSMRPSSDVLRPFVHPHQAECELRGVGEVALARPPSRDSSQLAPEAVGVVALA